MQTIPQQLVAMGLMTLAFIGSGSAALAQADANTPPIGGAHAQASGDLDEIVITARRRSESLSRVPVAATVFTGAALDQQGISNLQQLGNLMPGVNITSTIFIDSIFLRGVGSSPNDPGFEQQTGLFVDGIYYGNGRWISSASFDSDSVEILAGPQGVYFGKNTIAGAVNITTRNPTGKFEGSVKAGYEFNAKERYGEAVVSGPLTDTLAARLSVRASDMDGWATNANTGEAQPGGSDYVGRLTLVWTPTAHFDANFKAQLQRYTDNGPTARTILLNCAGPNNTPAPLNLGGFPVWGPTSGTASCNRNFDIPGQQNLRDGSAFSKVPAYTTALTLRWHNESGELTSTSGYNHYEFNSYSELNSSSLDAIETRDDASNSTGSTELRYQSTFKGPLNFMVGAYFSTSHFNNYFSPSLLPEAFQGASRTFEQQSSTEGKTRSYVGELLWNISEVLELDVGARYIKETKDSAFDTLSVAPNVAGFFPPLHFEAAQSFDNWSPQATLTWRPTSEFMAYAAYKTGFLSGGFAHAQITSPTSQISDFLFGPEKVKGGEIGTKFFLADRALQFDTVLYYYKYNGLQVSTFQPASFTFAVENAGRSESKGAELRGRWHIDQNFTLSGMVSRGTSKYTRYIGGCLPTATFATGCNVALPGGGFAQDFKGYSTSFAPNWSGRVALDYKTALSGTMTLNAGIGVNFSGSYVVGDVLTQPQWQKYDARAALEFGTWNAALIGNNLTDKAICNQAASRPLGGVGEVKCWLDRGREIRLELGKQF